MIDLILDTAGQKGTGKWTVIAACDLGVPLTLISEAVFARTLSAQKEERVAASQASCRPCPRVFWKPPGDGRRYRAGPLRQQVHLLRPGLRLMRAMASESNWEINNGGVALMWRGGCIIRSAFLGRIKEAFDRDPHLANLLLDPYFSEEVSRARKAGGVFARQQSLMPSPCRP